LSPIIVFRFGATLTWRLHTPDGLKVLREDAVKQGKSAGEGDVQFNRFRVFYLAVAEFFGLDNGEQ
jgi:hypothetical protein